MLFGCCCSLYLRLCHLPPNDNKKKNIARLNGQKQFAIFSVFFVFRFCRSKGLMLILKEQNGPHTQFRERQERIFLKYFISIKCFFFSFRFSSSFLYAVCGLWVCVRMCTAHIWTKQFSYCSLLEDGNCDALENMWPRNVSFLLASFVICLNCICRVFMLKKNLFNICHNWRPFINLFDDW